MYLHRVPRLYSSFKNVIFLTSVEDTFEQSRHPIRIFALTLYLSTRANRWIWCRHTIDTGTNVFNIFTCLLTPPFIYARTQYLIPNSTHLDLVCKTLHYGDVMLQRLGDSLLWSPHHYMPIAKGYSWPPFWITKTQTGHPTELWIKDDVCHLRQPPYISSFDSQPGAALTFLLTLIITAPWAVIRPHNLTQHYARAIKHQCVASLQLTISPLEIQKFLIPDELQSFTTGCDASRRTSEKQKPREKRWENRKSQVSNTPILTSHSTYSNLWGHPAFKMPDKCWTSVCHTVQELNGCYGALVVWSEPLDTFATPPYKSTVPLGFISQKGNGNLTNWHFDKCED